MAGVQNHREHFVSQGLHDNAFHTERVTLLRDSFSQASFRDLVVHTHDRASYDTRDKVFALLSHPAASDPKTGELLIKVDYDKTIELVYAEATIVMLRSNGNLDDLSFACQYSKYSQWPSWLPKWNEYPALGWLLCQREAPSFAACGTFKLDNQLRLSAYANGHMCLAVPGFVVDTIGYCQSMRLGKNWPAWFVWPSRAITDARSCTTCIPVSLNTTAT